MAVVTVSRQAGSLGTEIATQVAGQLGARFVDREVLHAAAREAGIPEHALEELHSERRQGIIEQVLEAMRSFPPLPYTAEGYPSEVPYGPTLMPTPSVLPVSIQDYVQMVQDVVQRLAQEPVVLVGRAGQVILKDHPQAVHVLLVAPLDVRVRRLMQRERLEQRQARQRVETRDAARRAFLWRHFGIQWLDPTLYDLVLNTARLSKEQAVTTICGLARARG